MDQDYNTVNPHPPGEFCLTPTAEAIFNLVSYCCQNRDIGVLVGAPGLGKTTALRQYKEKHNWSVRLCTMRPAISMADALRLVCDAMGVYAPRRCAEIHDVICDHQRWHNWGGLIIDEAQHVNDLTLDELRCIYDEAEIAIIFCGNPTFQSRFNNTRTASFGQFTSRIGMRLELLEPTVGDIEAICQHHRVTGKPEVAFLTKQAQTTSGLRVVVKLIKLARKIGGPEMPITLANMKAATKMLGVAS